MNIVKLALCLFLMNLLPKILAWLQQCHIYQPKAVKVGKKGHDLTITSPDSIRSRSVTGSNQPKPLNVLMPLPAPDKCKAKAKPKAKTKAKVANKKKEDSTPATPLAQIKRKDKAVPVSSDSPAMGTRSKKKKSLDFN